MRLAEQLGEHPAAQDPQFLGELLGVGDAALGLLGGSLEATLGLGGGIGEPTFRFGQN